MANYSAYVQKYPDLMAHYNKNIAGSGKSMDQWGAEHWKSYGNKEKRTIPGMGPAPDPTIGGPTIGSYAPEPGAATLPSYEDATMLPTQVYYGSAADTTSTAPLKTASSYVDLSPDLASAWELIDAANQGKDVNTLFADKYPHPAGLTPAQQAEYWQKRGATSKEAFGRAHAGEDMALKLGTYKQSGTDYKIGSDPWKELFTSKAGQFGTSLNYPDTPQSTAEAPLTRWEMFDPQLPASSDVLGPETTGPGDPEVTTTTPPDWSNPTSSVYVSDEVQAMDMATLTDEMDLSNKLTEIINMDSPLFKAAATKALQAMQKRGIVNSSLANEAVMNAILDVAMPIATAEVQALQQNLYYNTDWTNQQKTDANKYFYERMLTKMKSALDIQLQKMVQSFQAWGRYGDWINRIVTSPGADQDAWKRMLDAMKGGGGWPEYPGN